MGDRDDLVRSFLSIEPFFLDFVNYFLPEINTAKVLKTEVAMQPGEFIDPITGRRRSDILFLLRYDIGQENRSKGKGAGKRTQRDNAREIFVYILIEHQSSVDHSMALRLLIYMGRIWEKYIKERKDDRKKMSFQVPPIIPIVFYEGSRRWTAATRLHAKIMEAGQFAPYVPDFEYLLVASVPDQSLTQEEMDTKGIQGGIRYLLEILQMKHKDPEKAAKDLARIFDKLDPKTRETIQGLFRVIARYLFKDSEELMGYSIDQIERGNKVSTTLLKTWKKFAKKEAEIEFEKGVEKGVEKGIKKEKIQTILEMLNEKFPSKDETVSNTYQTQLEKLSIDQLTQLRKEVSKAKHLSELSLLQED